VIWIHAVSVGETRAVSALYRELRKKFPDASFVVSSVTETGHAEAKRALPDAKSYFFLPLDFSWLMKKFVGRIQPDLLILVEGEFWYHLLKSVKEQGGKVLLVNGKLSERSYALSDGCAPLRKNSSLLSTDFVCKALDLKRDLRISAFLRRRSTQQVISSST
jgi:3-deoxy-D-manno-octulosonic-acid transferase